MEEISFKMKDVYINVQPSKLRVGMIDGVTLMAIELWNDRGFIVKRIKEQGRYKQNLEKRFKNGELSLERKNELDESCHFVYRKLVRRLAELEKE